MRYMLCYIVLDTLGKTGKELEPGFIGKKEKVRISWRGGVQMKDNPFPGSQTESLTYHRRGQWFKSTTAQIVSSSLCN